jgi:hypothetical protein
MYLPSLLMEMLGFTEDSPTPPTSEEGIVDTPFTCGGSVMTFPTLHPRQRLVLRVAAGSYLIHGCVDGVPTTTTGGFFLQGGEAMELDARQTTTVKVINVTGDPEIFWYIR